MNLYLLATADYVNPPEEVSGMLVRAADEADARAVGVEASKLGPSYEGFSDPDDLYVTLVTDKGRGLVTTW